MFTSQGQGSQDRRSVVQVHLPAPSYTVTAEEETMAKVTIIFHDIEIGEGSEGAALMALTASFGTRREVVPAPEHQWRFYMNGTFCDKCGTQLGSNTPCR